MAIYDKIRDEKMPYDINREAAKKSPILSGKNYKYECLTGEEILPFNQREVAEQAKCTYSPFTKSFWKTNKNDGRSRRKANRRPWRAWKTTY